MIVSVRRFQTLLFAALVFTGCSAPPPKTDEGADEWKVVAEYTGSLPYHWDACLIGLDRGVGRRGRPNWRVTERQRPERESGERANQAAPCSVPIVVIPDESTLVVEKNPIAQTFFCESESSQSCYSSRNIELPGDQLVKALEYANAFAKFDSVRKQQQAEYQRRFAIAASFDDFKSFSKDYGSHDPDQLIPKLESRLKAAIYPVYRQEYVLANTLSPNQLESTKAFLSKYDGTYDPDKLVPSVRELRDHLETAEYARQAVLRAQEQAQEAAQHKQNQLDEFGSAIALCEMVTRFAREGIEKEKKIGTISGYVDKEKLYKYGQDIERCNQTVPAAYQQYKRAGGSKSLEQLKNNQTVKAMEDVIRQRKALCGGAPNCP